jgi:hypothetical protein
LLNKGRTFQAQPGAVRDHTRRMMVTNDLDLLRPASRAMAMMKIKALGFPRLNHFDLSAKLPIVISGYHNRLAVRSQVLQELRGFPGSRLIMNKVAENNQAPRFVFLDQLHQALGNRGHPPHRHEPASRALA